MTKLSKFGWIIFLLCLEVGCNGAQEKWEFGTPMPHGRYFHDALLGPDGKIYVMGGAAFKVVPGIKKSRGANSWLIDKYNDGKYSNLIYDFKILNLNHLQTFL